MSPIIKRLHFEIDRLPNCRYCFAIETRVSRKEARTEDKCFGMTIILPHLFLKQLLKSTAFPPVICRSFRTTLTMDTQLSTFDVFFTHTYTHTHADADAVPDVFVLAAIIVPLACAGLAVLALLCCIRSVFLFLFFLI